MILINEDELKPGTTFNVQGKPEMVKRILAKKYGRNPDDFEYRQANNDYIYKPKRKYGTTTSSPTTQTPPTDTAEQQPQTTPSDDEEGGLMKPTVEWMRKMYDKFNDELFGGELGPCYFVTKTRGKMNLGRFRSLGDHLFIDRYSRRMYVCYNSYYGFGGDKTYINKDNFYSLFVPEISLNDAYSAPEEDWCNTLIHEMCHYYTYMYGYAPKQSHGSEFRSISQTVCSRSNGRFVITRLASAEDMARHKLDDRVQKQYDQRKANKLARTMFVLIQMRDGKLRIVRTDNSKLLAEIKEIHDERQDASRIIAWKGPEATDYFDTLQYRSNSRTYRFWTAGKSLDSFLEDLSNVEPILDINYDDNMENENYSRDVVDIITERVMTEIKNNRMGGDAIAITPDMNLSDVSPLEMA